MPTGIYEHKKQTYPQWLITAINIYYTRDGMTIVETAQAIGAGMTPKIVQRCMERHSIPRRVARKRRQSGSANANWKGSDVGYSGAHRRLDALHGKPKSCVECGTKDKRKSYDWANLSGKFDDPKDYKRLCRSCHSKLDRKERNFE